LGIGDLGFGVWGLGVVGGRGATPHTPIPNPQSPMISANNKYYLKLMRTKIINKLIIKQKIII